jgi:hypothetical protein
MNIAVAKDVTTAIDAVFFVKEYFVRDPSVDFSDALRDVTLCFDPPRIDALVISVNEDAL